MNTTVKFDPTRPLAPEVMGDNLKAKLERCMETSPHPYHSQFPTLLHWLIFELAWAKGWMNISSKAEERLLLERNGAAKAMLREMLDTLDGSIFSCKCAALGCDGDEIAAERAAHAETDEEKN